ncbi:PREDICTED: uncharacterized protein LOC105449259 isoform X2 [Wasmannia auropunctata]|nr:PREDICTED: uncharacterized protein LOC105449259 isoform X2 [Wasmannia auropunctata]XP_011686668.1 PREDICTED: uncharacterized protein LOC105449259 isoform X2 [Wasmannia auropunctata]XP_011686670.1 PREDICTED: uncharacterized protein LOC105449259 isoform X2 [Wasmannia auropunctata]
MTSKSRSAESVSATSQNQQTNEANDLPSNEEQNIADPLTANPLESEQGTLIVKEEEQSNDRCSSKIKKTESSNLQSDESMRVTSQDQQTNEANDLPSDEEQDIVEPLTPVLLESDKEALVKDEESDKDSDKSETDSEEELKKDCYTLCQELGCTRCFGRYTVYIAACCAFSVHLVSVNIGTFLGKYVATVITNICCCIYCQNWCCPGLSE